MKNAQILNQKALADKDAQYQAIRQSDYGTFHHEKHELSTELAKLTANLREKERYMAELLSQIQAMKKQLESKEAKIKELNLKVQEKQKNCDDKEVSLAYLSKTLTEAELLTAKLQQDLRA